MNKKRDYKKEYREYQGKPEQIKNRSMRNAARREMEKAGKVHKGDGMEVDHKKPLSRGGSNSKRFSGCNPYSKQEKGSKVLKNARCSVQTTSQRAKANKICKDIVPCRKGKCKCQKHSNKQ